VFTRFRSHDRGDIVVVETPPAAVERCDAGGKFVERQQPLAVLRLAGLRSVPVENVVGEVTLTYWPPGRISFR
jgi:hypothetical protein